MKGARAERSEFENSAAGRLRRWAVEAPFVGALVQFAGDKVRGKRRKA
jgi:hypothetical protein